MFWHMILLLKSLCDQLGITINELLSGERIAKEEYQTKFEENILNTIDYSNKKSEKAKKRKCIIPGIIGLIIIIFLSMYLVDLNRMSNNKPVIFSTWGYEYCPPVDLPEGALDLAITKYIEEINDAEVKKHEKEKSFAEFKVYLIEQKHESLYYYYTWVLGETYYLEDGQIVNDGSYYEKDMKAIFPYYVRKDMEKVYSDGTIEKLRLEIAEQVKSYFNG